MPRAIDIADDIYEYVQRKAIPFEDDFNSALRRLLKLPPEKGLERRTRRRPGERKTRTIGGVDLENYRSLLLRALIELGGSTTRRDVLTFLSQRVEFPEVEQARLDNGMLRWEKAIDNAKGSLLKGGYMSSHTPKGIWEVTHLGRTAVLEESEAGKNVLFRL